MSKELKVVYVQPSLAKYRTAVYRELAGRPGIDFKLLYGDQADITNVAPEGFDAECKPMRQLNVLGQLVMWHGAQWQAAGNPQTDVLSLSWGSRYLSLPPALARARKQGLPVLLWGHGYSKSETGFRKRLRTSIAGMATALLFYDQRTADQAIEDGWSAEQVFVAANAIDQKLIQQNRDKWLSNQDRLREFASEQGVEGKRILLHVSRLSPENRLDLLIEALANLKDSSPDLMAIVIGNGQQEQERLTDLATQAGVETQLRFLGAIYEEEQLAPWFLLSDLFVYPANIGLSLLHAFGYGLPVITADDLAAQNPEIIALEDRVNSVLYRAGDTSALTNAISQLLQDETTLTEMGLAAHQTVLQHYTVSNMVDGMQAAIEYCATQCPRR